MKERKKLTDEEKSLLLEEALKNHVKHCYYGMDGKSYDEIMNDKKTLVVGKDVLLERKSIYKTYLQLCEYLNINPFTPEADAAYEGYKIGCWESKPLSISTQGPGMFYKESEDELENFNKNSLKDNGYYIIRIEKEQGE